MENKSDEALRAFEVCDYDLTTLIRELMKHDYEIRIRKNSVFYEPKYQIDLIRNKQYSCIVIDKYDYERPNFDLKDVLLYLLTKFDENEEEPNGNNS